MNVLVINCGSTSLKYGLFHGEPGGRLDALAGAVLPLSAAASLDWLVPRLPQAPDLIAHRLVHGGANGDDVAILTESMLAALEADTALAPLHTVHALQLVRLAAALGLPQAVAFDGGFHATLDLADAVLSAEVFDVPFDLPDLIGVDRGDLALELEDLPVRSLLEGA